jgi:hypothetical protein
MGMLQILLRTVAGVVVIMALGIGVLVVLARFSDGPIAIVAGGPFRSGEPHQGPEPDWSFVRDVDTVEFQLLDPPRSRTTWILLHEGRIYIPSGYMTTSWGRLWKQWPPEAERDGRALLRVGDTVYPRQLVRVGDSARVAALVAEINRKYGAGATPAAVESGYLWLFELQPRP